MGLSLKPWQSSERQRLAVSRILVHLSGGGASEPLIEFAVQLAGLCEARLRGLTVVDTSELEKLVTVCESAAYAVSEHERLEAEELRQIQVRLGFSRACLDVGLDFDVRRRRGCMFDVLREEAKFHDLSLMSVPTREHRRRGDPGGPEALKLILAGVSPLLVLRGVGELPQRILLVQDGSPASCRTLRTFLSQGLFPEASFRLLSVGPTVAAAKQTLREHVASLVGRLSDVETGFVVGKTPHVVPEYATQWEADLVVVGAQRKPPLIGGFLRRRSAACSI